MHINDLPPEILKIILSFVHHPMTMYSYYWLEDVGSVCRLWCELCFEIYWQNSISARVLRRRSKTRDAILLQWKKAALLHARVQQEDAVQSRRFSVRLKKCWCDMKDAVLSSIGFRCSIEVKREGEYAVGYYRGLDRWRSPVHVITEQSPDVFHRELLTKDERRMIRKANEAGPWTWS